MTGRVLFGRNREVLPVGCRTKSIGVRSRAMASTAATMHPEYVRAKNPGKIVRKIATRVALIVVSIIVIVWIVFPFFWADPELDQTRSRHLGSKWIPWVRFEPQGLIPGCGSGTSAKCGVGCSPARRSAWAGRRWQPRSACRPPTPSPASGSATGDAASDQLLTLSQRIMNSPVVFAPPIFVLARWLGYSTQFRPGSARGHVQCPLRGFDDEPDVPRRAG